MIISILAMLIFSGMVIFGLLGVVLLFRWLMKALTGYDILHMRAGHHRYLQEDVDFAQLQDWDHERGFGVNDNRARKPRKAKATPHYDRLQKMAQVQQQATPRLSASSSQADDSRVVALATLVKDDAKQSVHE